MGFEDLVSDDPPPSREEMERLNRVIREYEAENVRLRDERDVAQQTYEGVLEGKEERQKETNNLHKKINSLKQQITIERKASEGLTKKAGMLDIDLKLHKEERKSLVEEQILNRRKVADLERKLLDDRAKRLRNIHENDIMRKKNLELEARNKICEADTRKASEDLLVKIQKLQSATELVEKQRRTIEAQGTEMLELNREVTALKEAIKSMSDDFLRLERRSASMKKERDEFEIENFRLRREMVSTATSTSRRAAAFDGYRPVSKQSSQRASTSIGGSRGGSMHSYGVTKPSTAGGFADTHSFQFANWDGEAPIGQRQQQSMSPPPSRSNGRGSSPQRAVTTGARSRPRQGDSGGTFSSSFDDYAGVGSGSVGGDVSQMTMDSGMVMAMTGAAPGVDETVRERYIQASPQVQVQGQGQGHSKGKGHPEDTDDLEESADTFATTALSVHDRDDAPPSSAPALTSTTATDSATATGTGVASAKNRKKKKELTIDAGSPPAALRPLTGTSPLPSPMTSPGPRGPLAAAGVLSPVLSQYQAGGAGDNNNIINTKSTPSKVKRGMLTSQSRGKVHQRGRTSFVGQGLGMLSSPTPSYSAGGSAKQVLARILSEG